MSQDISTRIGDKLSRRDILHCPHCGESLTEQANYCGTGCGPKQVEIQVQFPDPAVYSVVLFVRLEEITSGEKTAWTALPMNPLGDAYFGLELTVEGVFPEVRNFEAAHLQMQVVATDQAGNETGRTPVDSQVSVERWSR